MHKHTLIASALAAVLAASGAASAAENSGGGKPPMTSTPTWTVPGAQSSNVTSKEEGGRHTPFHNKYSPTFRGVQQPGEEKQSTNEICPPKCGPLGPSPTIPPAPQAAQRGGDKPVKRPPMECYNPPCPGEPDPRKEESFKQTQGTLVCCCEGKPFDNTKYKCNELGKLKERNPQ
ncbi:hypothetical protein [Thiobacter aerophilum]|uniref:Uncharacterized protein n=1 Tax=Thiobacter aerophilum TaxID=3121275 RepID=A0ABV0EKQ2_9BURK